MAACFPDEVVNNLIFASVVSGRFYEKLMTGISISAWGKVALAVSSILCKSFLSRVVFPWLLLLRPTVTLSNVGVLSFNRFPS